MLFVLDANYSPKLAEGLNLLEKGNFKSPYHAEIKHIDDIIYTGATDPEVIEVVGKHKGIVVTQDRDFKRIKHYAAAYREHGVGVVWFKSHKDIVGYWSLVCHFVCRWEDMKKAVHSKNTPFAFFVDKNSVSEMHF